MVSQPSRGLLARLPQGPPEGRPQRVQRRRLRLEKAGGLGCVVDIKDFRVEC